VGSGFRAPLESKVEAICKITQPTTKKEVKQFLGMVGYYQMYIKDYARKAAPLTDRLGKAHPKRISWDAQCEASFQQLKEALVSKPVLHAPEYDIDFVLTTDASQTAIGSYLSQVFDDGEHPVLYLSRKLNKAELNYSVVEKECLSMVWSISKLRHYLDGKPFKLRTDHRPLTHLAKFKDGNQRLARWALALQHFDYTVDYTKGSLNVVADYLSRHG
jgi:hypothetical protein